MSEEINEFERDHTDDFGFSLETRKWLSGWLSGGVEITTLPSIVVSECKEYLPDTSEQLRLYKALTENDVLDENNSIFTSDKPSSWTHTISVAQEWFKTDRPVVSVVVGNGNILIDTTQLDPNYIQNVLGGYPDEHEVILLPGTYRVTIVGDEER